MTKFNTLDELATATDEIISDNINKYLDNKTIREAIVLLADDLNKENPDNVNQEQFDKIVQISSAMTKLLAKPICHAVINSAQTVNALLEENEHLNQE